MTRMPSSSNLSATFNDFLFATVCEERNEMPLSVISALARLDLDPWAEAAVLARMPADGAARHLSALLAGVVDLPPTQPDRATIAARLVALLPAAKTDAPRPGAAAILTGPQRRAAGFMWLIILASMVASLVMGNLASHSSASEPIRSAVAPR
jgi:hypothetical protein